MLQQGCVDPAELSDLHDELYFLLDVRQTLSHSPNYQIITLKNYHITQIVLPLLWGVPVRTLLAGVPHCCAYIFVLRRGWNGREVP
jgi:hypothetical protein